MKYCSAAIVMDVDGVLMHGAHAIAGASTALETARRHLPVLLLTNGSGSAAKKAAKIEAALGLSIDPQAVILSHSPLRAPAHRPFLRSAHLLVVAHTHAQALEIAAEHEWTSVVSLQQLMRANPLACPLRQLDPALVRDDREGEAHPTFDQALPFDAVVLAAEPCQFGEALQLVIDVIRGRGRLGVVADAHAPDHTQQEGEPSPSESAIEPQSQHVAQLPLYICNLDLVYQDRFPVPRFTSGAFLACLQTLFRATTGKPLHFIPFGKPLLSSMQFAEETFQTLFHKIPSTLYMIGDNPESDIKGANEAGAHWRSCLVRTGCFQGTHNDPKNPADFVFNDVAQAVSFILSQHSSDS